MTKTELNEECEKHGTCKECKYREWNVTIGYECSFKNEDLEEE